eukprot:30936-Pelagococcus_subviridis.AAC.31
MAAYFSVASTLGAFKYLCMNFEYFVSRASAGLAPLRYFPESAPPARGVHGRRPTLKFEGAHASASSVSNERWRRQNEF